MREVGNSVQLRFDRNRDLLLNFFSSPSWPLRNDPHIFVGNVGIRFDREIVKRDDAPNQQANAQPHNEHAIAQCKVDQKSDHPYCSSAVEESCSALVATFCCGCSPLVTCTKPSLVCGPNCSAVRRNCLSPMGTKTQSLSCRWTTADAGITTRSISWRPLNVAVTNIPARI